MPSYGAVEEGEGGGACVDHVAAHRRGRRIVLGAAALGVLSLGLAATAAVLHGGAGSLALAQFQYTTTASVACGCCGVVGCYCTNTCSATGLASAPYAAFGGAFDVPPAGTAAAVTPDWTDVVTSLTREVSEDTAEIAGLKSTVLRLANWQKQAEPRLEYLTHIQKWMREHPGGVTPGTPGRQKARTFSTSLKAL